MKRLLSTEEFAANPTLAANLFRLSPEPADLTQADSRVIRYIFSTSAVARDGHTINQDGWDFSGFDNYRSFLWAHDGDSPPIGTVIEHSVRNGVLSGAVKYVDRDIYPFADMIFQMVKQRFISAVSISWLPTEWKWSTDKNRPGGIDFLKQDCLEISQVPVPAQPVAIATARAAGIDTSPMYEWAEKVLDGGGMVTVPRAQLELLRKEAKMPARAKRSKTADWQAGASKSLPSGEDGEWDGPAAAKRMLDAAGFDGDAPDSEKARRGFLVFDAANPTLGGSYKLPFADIVDDKLKAMPAGIRAAAARLPDTDIPQAEKDKAGEILDAYKKKMGIGSDDDTQKASAPFGLGRDLCDVGDLASLLQWLAWVQQGAEWEKDVEGDGSDVPDRLAEVIEDLGQILLDMAKEEVSELVALLTGQDVAVVMEQKLSKGQVAVLRFAFGVGALARSAPARRAALEAVTRGGKVLSGANKAHLQRALEHHQAMGECIQTVLDSADDGEADEEDDVDEVGVEERSRRVRLLALTGK